MTSDERPSEQRSAAAAHTTATDSGSRALSHGLKTRHLTMMGLGSAIGAGLFLGSGQGVALAGPAVVVSYLIAGLLVIALMWMLAEMAAALPSSGSFSTYAELGLGRWAGFTVGWLYWFTLIMVLGVEITGASAIIAAWLPAVPQWIVAAVFVAIFAVVNLWGVRNFGEFEFWFAAIKVAVIVAFLVIGVALVLGWIPANQDVGLAVIQEHGGFVPHGVAGIVSALLVVVFAFGGIEIITIAAAEADDPRRSIVRASRSIVWRILLFYVGSIAVIAAVIPWDDPRLTAADGPFAAVLQVAGMPAAAVAMMAVVVVALLSAFNANVYGTSRMAYSLSVRGDGSRHLLTVSKRGVPTSAVWVSIFFGVVSVALNWWLPDQILGILLNAVGATLVVIWFFIVASHIALRPRLRAEGNLPVQMPGFPALTWVALAMLIALAVLMLTESATRNQLASAVGLTAFIAALYPLHRRFTRSSASATEQPTPGQA